MKTLKKVLIGLLICIVLIPVVKFGLFYFSMTFALVYNYSGLEKGGDGFQYLIRDPIKKAGVCGYTYDPSSGTNEISIPESFGDYPVKGLGGYVGKGAPCPFNIDVKGFPTISGVGLSGGSFDWYIKGEGLEPEYVDVVLNIGPNIREIYADQFGIVSGKKLVIVRVYANCDSGNTSFYSENGILYRKNGEVVDGFLYWNRSYTDPPGGAP